MTTLHVVGEPLSLAVARRLRGILAEARISQKTLQDLTGWGRGHVQQRYYGKVPLNVAELEHIEQTVGIRTEYLMTGQGIPFAPPPDDDGTAAQPTNPQLARYR
jgi:transcriptional regulator with XRE-family HTH domain